MTFVTNVAILVVSFMVIVFDRTLLVVLYEYTIDWRAPRLSYRLLGDQGKITILKLDLFIFCIVFFIGGGGGLFYYIYFYNL